MNLRVRAAARFAVVVALACAVAGGAGDVIRVPVSLAAARPVVRGKPRRIPTAPLLYCLVMTLLLSISPGCRYGGDRVNGRSSESPASPVSPVQTAPPAAGVDPATTRMGDSDGAVDWDSWGDSLPRRIARGKVTFGPFLSPGRSVDWFWCPDGERLLLTVPHRGSIELWVAGARTGTSSPLYREEDLEAIFPIGWAGPAQVICLDLSRHRTGELMSPMTLKVIDFSGDRTKCRILATLNGRLCGACVTPGGGFACVYYMDSPRTARLIRVDTTTGRRVDLVKDRLAANDFVPPAWFSPDGRSAAMLEFEKYGGPVRLTFLDFVQGRTRSVGPYLQVIDLVCWNPGGTHVAHKVADGTHKTVEGLESTVVVSPKVRILDRTGNIVRFVGLPTGELIESLAWKDDETLILWEVAKTRNFPEVNKGPAWVVSLTGAPRPAGPDEAEPFYPAGGLTMPHGRSPRYRVEERWWRGSAGEYLNEINVIPIRRDQNLVD